MEARQGWKFRPGLVDHFFSGVSGSIFFWRVDHFFLDNPIVSALELDQDYINALVLKDRQEYEEEFEKWVSQPIEPYYTLRMMPTIYMSYDMPGNFPTENQAAEYVAKIAKEKHAKAWLSLSRRERIYITEKGEIGGKIKTTIENVNYPYTRVK